MAAEYAIAGLQLAGGYFASQNIRATALLNREISEMNAQFAELDAYDSILAGETRKTEYQSVVDQTLSDQQTIMAAQGGDIGFGSAGSIAAETTFTADANKMEIQKRAQEQALGYTDQAANFRTSGVLAQSRENARASDVMFQSAVGAAKTGISGYRASQ